MGESSMHEYDLSAAQIVHRVIKCTDEPLKAPLSIRYLNKVLPNTVATLDCGCSHIPGAVLYSVAQLPEQQQRERSDVMPPRCQTCQASIVRVYETSGVKQKLIRFLRMITYCVYRCTNTVTKTLQKHHIPPDDFVRFRPTPLLRQMSHRKNAVKADGDE